MSRPIILGAERLSGGRVATVVSVRPGVRVTVVGDQAVTADEVAAILALLPPVQPATVANFEGD